MKKIVLASSNQHKVKEFHEILNNYEILSLKDIGFLDDIEETGTVSEFLKDKGLDYDVVADDSGCCCNALNGEPGIYSARYAGDHDFQKNRDLVREKLRKKKDKSAYFNCTIVLYHIDGTYESFDGKTTGVIIDEEKGSKEFGYDCIFLSDDLGKTFGEATAEEKNSVSHRKRAIEKLKKVL